MNVKIPNEDEEEEEEEIEETFRWGSTTQIDNQRHYSNDDSSKETSPIPSINKEDLYIANDEIDNTTDKEVEDVINLRKALNNYKKMRSFNVDSQGRVVDCGFRSNKSKLFKPSVTSYS